MKSSPCHGVILYLTFLVPVQSGFAGERTDGEDKVASPGLDVATIQEFRNLDRDRDGVLDRKEFFSSEIAQRAVESGGRDRAGQIFNRIDLDESDSLTLFELASSQHNRNVRLLDPETARLFAEFDRDDDGVIQRSEFERVEGESGDFSEIDLNGNGSLGAFEFLQSQPDREKHLMDGKLAPRFASLDADDSGAICRTEYSRGHYARIAIKKGTPEKIPEMFQRIDLNGNGDLSPGEFARFQKEFFHRCGDKKSREMFSELDRNRDGTLSRREYSRSPYAKASGDRDRIDEVFARIDVDGNGEITPEEYADRFSRLKGMFGPRKRSRPED